MITLADLDSLDESYLKQIGLIGMHNITNKPEKQNKGNGLDIYAMHMDEIDKLDNIYETTDNIAPAINSLVDEMRASVFRVRLTNTMNDLIMPLSDQFELLSLEERLQAAQQHTENLTYSRSIINAIERLGRDDGPMAGMFRTMLMEYRRFQRNPVWNTLRLFTENFIMPMLRTAGSILFGRKREKSDTDRIVNVLEKQLEFMRTGQIDQSQGFFERLGEQGILGMSARGLGRGALGALGVTSDRAQERQTATDRGEKTEGLLMDPEGWLSSKLFGGEVTMGSRGANIEKEHQNELIQTLKAMPIRIAEQMYGVLTNVMYGPVGKHQQEKTVGDQFSTIDMMVDNLIIPLNKQSDLLTSLTRSTQKVMVSEEGHVADNLSMMTMSSSKQENMLDSFHREVADRDNRMLDEMDQLNSYNRIQTREQRRTRRAMIMGNVLKVLGTISTGVVSMVSGIGGLVAALAGGGIMTKLMSGGKGGKGGGFLSRMGKGMRVGGILGIAGMGISALTDRFTEEGSTENKVGNTLGTAASWGAGGALIGSVIPGVGTAIGGGIGAIAGAIYENREEVMELFDAAWNRAKIIGASIIDWFKNPITNVQELFGKVRGFSDSIDETIEGWFGDGVMGKVSQFLLNPLGNVIGIVDRIREGFDYFFNKVKDIGDAIGDFVLSPLNSVTDRLQSAAKLMGFGEEEKPETTASLEQMQRVIDRNHQQVFSRNNEPEVQQRSNRISIPKSEVGNDISGIDMSPVKRAIEENKEAMMNANGEEVEILGTMREFLEIIATNTKEKKEQTPQRNDISPFDNSTYKNVMGG